MYNTLQVEDIGDENTPWQQDEIDAELGGVLGTIGSVLGGTIGTAIGGPGLGTAVGAMAGGAGAKVIGSIVKGGKKKKVVSVSGRTSMTPSGQLVENLTVSTPVSGASGTSAASDLAITAGLAHIQSTLDRAEAQRVALLSQAQDNKYHRKILKKLDALAACNCKKTGAMARFRAAFGL